MRGDSGAASFRHRALLSRPPQSRHAATSVLAYEARTALAAISAEHVRLADLYAASDAAARRAAAEASVALERAANAEREAGALRSHLEATTARADVCSAASMGGRGG